ncbi:hypothetical protein FISHEDRAFT_58938 [Fistulina hepatica ATCC 64428]|uniref:Uncharacterized protein n=1 Tax=Fistulina hepatica ATCC 64428 TaxID=1128425 RepID=A0A0D7AC75_9AGAR|nr:hypothetical protein FISHEDRAFT_58938 [Fistulina hepatica ATCC 64428]
MTLIIYDDRDTEQLIYNGSWYQGAYNASSVHETGTLTSSDVYRVNVSFTFPVPAVAFYYYGIPRCCGAWYEICVDCYPNDMNWTSINALNTSDDGKNPPIVLFNRTWDTLAVHEIILMNGYDDRFPDGHSQITIDQFVLDDGVTTTSLSLPTSSISSTSTTSAQFSIAPSSASPSASTKNHSVLGGIIGGVCGGVVIVLIIAGLCVFRRRRAVGADSAVIEPLQAPSMSVTNQTSQTGSSGFVGRRPLKQARFEDSNPGGSSSASNPSDALNGSSNSESDPVYEHDAGPFVLPPQYQDVFHTNMGNS